MKEWLISLSEHAIVGLDLIALMVVVIGSVEVVLSLPKLVRPSTPNSAGRAVWLRFARWLVAALTFQLAADVVESSITTSWQAIARLGAIAVIRTLLDVFLGRDVAEQRARERESLEGRVTPSRTNARSPDVSREGP